FSSRAFGHRMLLSGPAFSARIETLETTFKSSSDTIQQRDLTPITLPAKTERVLTALTIAKGPNFPAQYGQMHAIFRRRLYALTESDDRIQFKSEIGSMSMFLDRDMQNQRYTSYYNELSETGGSVRELFEALYRPLVARAFNITRGSEALDFNFPDDRV